MLRCAVLLLFVLVFVCYTSQNENQGSSSNSSVGNDTKSNLTVANNTLERNQTTKKFKPILPDSVKDQINQVEPAVCYEGLGCFDMGRPWRSLFRPVIAPQSPEEVDTNVIFYSRQKSEKPFTVFLYPKIDCKGMQFDPNKTTVIIVHGFVSSANAEWMISMKDAYFKKMDVNMLLVDWSKGSESLNYLQVAGNTRVVGRQLGIFVNYLIEHFGASPSKFHLIGHSLGAHICSYLAKHVPGIARLTALDPAQPGFEGFSKEVRLDKEDAEFVDVVHTDAKPFIPTLGFGMIAPIGDVDFYLNGGMYQPGCTIIPKYKKPNIKNIFDLSLFPIVYIKQLLTCAHEKAYQYFQEALAEKCTFWGEEAHTIGFIKNTINSLSKGWIRKFWYLHHPCSMKNCVPLGFDTGKSTLRGIYIIKTFAKEPYCIPPKTTSFFEKAVLNIESVIKNISKELGYGGQQVFLKYYLDQALLRK